jgi:putative acetyltransferase
MPVAAHGAVEVRPLMDLPAPSSRPPAEPRNVVIRREAAGDAAAVARVHAAAFATADGPPVPVEVALVEQLRSSPHWLPHLSLVACSGEKVVGHVVCTRAEVGPEGAPALGLGPIGVRPDHQDQGVGSALMHAVLGAADACDESLVALLGEPAYYRRFGFVPAADLGIDAPDDSWGAYFQARPLSRYSDDLRGAFRYAAPFQAL